MVSVGVSALGWTELHIVEPGVKVNGEYYRETLLKPWNEVCFQICVTFLSSLSSSSWQQGNAQSHRARETVALLSVETPAFKFHPTISVSTQQSGFESSWLQDVVRNARTRQDKGERHGRAVSTHPDWDQLDQRVIDRAGVAYRFRSAIAKPLSQKSAGHMQNRKTKTNTNTTVLTLTDTGGAVLTLMLGYRSLYITRQ